jgi:hypothetical protein
MLKRNSLKQKTETHFSLDNQNFKLQTEAAAEEEEEEEEEEMQKYKKNQKTKLGARNQ